MSGTDLAGLKQCAAALVMLSCFSAQLPAQEFASAPGHLYIPKQPLAVRSAPSASVGPRSVAVLELPALAPETISSLSQPPHQTRVGVNRPLPAFDATAGQWWTNTDGARIWSLQIRSLGATGLRLHLRNFDAGPGVLW